MANYRKVRYGLSEAGWNNVDFSLNINQPERIDVDGNKVPVEAVSVIGDGPILHIKSFNASMPLTVNTSRGAGDTIIAQSTIPGDITGDFMLTEESMIEFNKYWKEKHRWDLDNTDPALSNIPDLNMVMDFSEDSKGEKHTKKVFGMRMTNYTFGTSQGNTSIDRPLTFSASDLHEDDMPWLGTVRSKGEFLPLVGPKAALP